MKSDQNTRTYEQNSTKEFHKIHGSPEKAQNLACRSSDSETQVRRPALKHENALEARVRRPPLERSPILETQIPKKRSDNEKDGQGREPRLGQECEGEQNENYHYTPSKDLIGTKRQAYNRTKKSPTCCREPSLKVHQAQKQKEFSDTVLEYDKPNEKTSEVEPVCRENHAIEDHDVVSHAIGNHDVARGHGGETDQVDIGQKVFQGDAGMDQKTKASENIKKEDPRSVNHHARDNHDATSHEIGTHVIGQHNQGESRQIKIGNGQTQTRHNDFPWTAPRVMLEFLKHDMGLSGPTIWTIDNYDGEATWAEIGETPNHDYKDDKELSANQYHKMAVELYQWEGATDNLIQKRKITTDEMWRECEWHKIKAGVEVVCMEMYREVEELQLREESGSTATTERVWDHKGQTYVVRDWSAQDDKTDHTPYANIRP